MVKDGQFRMILAKVGKYLGIGALALLMLGVSGWCILALRNFGHLASGLKQGLAYTYGVGALAAFGAFLVPRWRWKGCAVHAGLFLVVLVPFLLQKPSNDRVWNPEVAKLAWAEFDGDRVTVHNIRNFQYRTVGDYTISHYDKTYDLKDLDSMDLLASYWMGPDIAHIFVSFGFKGKDFLSFSIEMRRELTEGGSTIKSFFRQYELYYVVGDERDLVRLRTNVRKSPPEDVYLYRLKGDPGTAKALFLEYIKEINHLKDTPEWYNTLTSNCTNTIWMHSRVNKGHVPYSWKILVSGHLPELLYEAGKIEGQGPFSELKQRSRINDLAQAADQAEDFSQRIRPGH